MIYRNGNINNLIYNVFRKNTIQFIVIPSFIVVDEVLIFVASVIFNLKS